MIRSFRSQALRKFWDDGNSAPLPVRNVARIARQLNALDAATAPGQMDFPGWRFHPLKGKPKRYAVDAGGNYRITFGFDGQDAVDVDIEDYH